jgi:dUTP pyrophosphatase
MYFSGYDIDAIRHKILLIADPNSGYTQEDFDKEFNPTLVSDNDSSSIASFKITFNYSNKSDNPDPEYATSGSSGFDIRANLSESIVIKPTEYKLIKTGLYFEIPENMEITIRSRSGLAFKHGVVVLNGIGTIDSDYRGEIGVLLINHGKDDFTIHNGDRIAQAVLSNVISKRHISFNKVAEISNNTERSSGGYGSTGIK